MSITAIKAEGMTGAVWGGSAILVERAYTFMEQVAQQPAAELTWSMVWHTALLAFVGAAVGFAANLLFKWIQKKVARKK